MTFNPKEVPKDQTSLNALGLLARCKLEENATQTVREAPVHGRERGKARHQEKRILSAPA